MDAIILIRSIRNLTVSCECKKGRKLKSPGQEMIFMLRPFFLSIKNKLIVAVELQKEWVDVCFFNSCIDDSSWCHRKIDSSVEDCPRNGYVVLLFPTLSLPILLYVN